MRWLDRLTGESREFETVEPIASGRALFGDPGWLPGEIALRLRDGREVVYVPKPAQEPASGAIWRSVDEEWKT